MASLSFLDITAPTVPHEAVDGKPTTRQLEVFTLANKVFLRMSAPASDDVATGPHTAELSPAVARQLIAALEDALRYHGD